MPGVDDAVEAAMKASGRKNRHFPLDRQPSRHRVKIKMQ